VAKKSANPDIRRRLELLLSEEIVTRFLDKTDVRRHCTFALLCSSRREKIVKFLQSNPVQVLLCVIVLLDAGIVIAQILLDLNSVKGN